MARATVLVWWAVVVGLVGINNFVEGDLGINWGELASHPIDPKIVVQMLRDNGVKKVKLFDANYGTVDALAGTGMEVMLGIPNDQLHDIADSYKTAKKWVKENCTKHLRDGGVDIKYVAVGNEPFLKAYKGAFVDVTLPAIKNIQKALDEAGVGDKIKATSPLNADVYQSASGKPSDGQFRSDVRTIMNDLVHFFKQNGSPFLVNIYPFLSLYLNPNFPRDYAYFGGGAQPVTDGNTQYYNVFEANFDTLVWSLKKAGTPDLPIIVGEVGWPTDGHKEATSSNAKKFYDGLFKKLATKKGTPLRHEDLRVYIFSLFDEDQKSIDPGAFERHWGIFTFDGKPKFPMDFSGQGNDKPLLGAKGVQYLDKQWCILDPDAQNMETLGAKVSWACGNADCSSLEAGASCGSQSNTSKASFAFNMYYQVNDQNFEACKFDGLAKIVKTDPSQGQCNFPIEIVYDDASRERFGFALGTTLLGGVLLISFFGLI